MRQENSGRIGGVTFHLSEPEKTDERVPRAEIPVGIGIKQTQTRVVPARMRQRLSSNTRYATSDGSSSSVPWEICLPSGKPLPVATHTDPSRPAVMLSTHPGAEGFLPSLPSYAISAFPSARKTVRS